MPLPLAAIGSVAAPIIGGALGSIFGGDDREQQDRYIQEQLKEVQAIPLPEQRALRLQQLTQAGVITPAMEQAITQQDSELKAYREDPRMRDAEMSALQKLQEIGDQGGLTATDKARIAEIQGNMRTAARGEREAAMMDAQSRGTVGGGAALMASLGAGQAAADRASRAGVDVAAQAEQRALDAILQSGNLGGQIRSQDFAQAEAKAAAQDAINRFNAQARGDVQSRNIGAMNQAQYANLGEQQRIADTNADIRNREEMYNIQAPQRTYENMIQKSGLTGQARTGAANAAGQRASDTRQMWGGIGQGVGYGAALMGMGTK